MVYEIDATVQRGTYIKKEVKNVPRHFSKAATSQYKKFTPFENRTKTGYVPVIDLDVSNFEYLLLFSSGRRRWKNQNKYLIFDTRLD